MNRTIKSAFAVALTMTLILTSCGSSTPYPTRTPTRRPVPVTLANPNVHWWVCGVFGRSCGKCSKSGPTLAAAGIGRGTELQNTGETLHCTNETDINGEPIGEVLAQVNDPRSGMDGTIWIPTRALD